MNTKESNSNLVDICSVTVDRTLPEQDRITEYVRRIKDPYHFKCNGMAVTAKFAVNGPSFEDCLLRIIV